MGYYKHVHASTGAQTVQLTQKAPTAIKVATDFSGMEGPVLAMRRLGNVTITHAMASDIDANCRRVIAEVSPHAKIFEDALSRSVKELPVEIDCYVFCFPCQDFSRAGTGNGVQNIRGTCWIAGLKVIKARKPRCVVAENVAGLLEKTHASLTKDHHLHGSMRVCGPGQVGQHARLGPTTTTTACVCGGNPL